MAGISERCQVCRGQRAEAWRCQAPGKADGGLLSRGEGRGRDRRRHLHRVELGSLEASLARLYYDSGPGTPDRQLRPGLQEMVP